jgi:hypothetical protein
MCTSVSGLTAPKRLARLREASCKVKENSNDRIDADTDAQMGEGESSIATGDSPGVPGVQGAKTNMTLCI